LIGSKILLIKIINAFHVIQYFVDSDIIQVLSLDEYFDVLIYVRNY